MESVRRSPKTCSTAGVIATQVHQIIPMTEDPIMRFFEGIFSDPDNWESNPPPDPTPAVESYAASSLDQNDAEPEEVSEAEIVEPKGEPANDTPPRIVEMIKRAARSNASRASDHAEAAAEAARPTHSPRKQVDRPMPGTGKDNKTYTAINEVR